MNAEGHLSGHLSEDELDHLLVGDGSPDAEEHARVCVACGERVAEFRAAVTQFNAASLHWSEAKSHTSTRALTGKAARARSGMRPGWSFAAALVVAAGIVLSYGSHGSHGISEEASTGQPAVQAGASGSSGVSAREAEIAGDNAMLEAIHAVIVQPEPSPAVVYNMAETEGAELGSARRGVRD